VRITIMGVLLALASAPAWCEDIAQVLQRSQAARLARLPASDENAPAVQALRRLFEQLRRDLRVADDVELRVVGAGTVAETLQGRVIVVNEAVAGLPDVCQRFVLAHELGHVVRGHWAQRVELYQRHIPGEVIPANTDPVAARLGDDASRQSHAHEDDADGYAMNVLLDMGHTRDELVMVFMRLGNHRTTATHPSVGKRVARLRQIEVDREVAAAQGLAQRR
jgi:Zn-dependent protease with chaperone function